MLFIHALLPKISTTVFTASQALALIFRFHVSPSKNNDSLIRRNIPVAFPDTMPDLKYGHHIEQGRFPQQKDLICRDLALEITVHDNYFRKISDCSQFQCLPQGLVHIFSS